MVLLASLGEGFYSWLSKRFLIYLRGLKNKDVNELEFTQFGYLLEGVISVVPTGLKVFVISNPAMNRRAIFAATLRFVI